MALPSDQMSIWVLHLPIYAERQWQLTIPCRPQNVLVHLHHPDVGVNPRQVDHDLVSGNAEFGIMLKNRGGCRIASHRVVKVLERDWSANRVFRRGIQPLGPDAKISIAGRCEVYGVPIR